MHTPELQIAGHVATIALRRPRQANRLEPDDLAAISAHVAQVNAQAEVRVLRLQASGKTFCAGYDIGRIGGAPVAFEAMVDAVEAARPVTIAVLQGGVYGGATDLALACDFRVGSHACEMFMPAARLGLHYYRSGLERYVTRLGVDVAKRLFLAGETLDAHEMKAVGFLTHLAPPEALGAVADALVAALAGMAPLALLPMKRHLNRLARGLCDADALQRDLEASVRSRDLREGRAAWAEKRTPRFTGE